MYGYFSIGMGGISLFLWYRVIVSVLVEYSRCLPILIKHKINIKIFCYIFLAVAILPSTANYPQRLFCCELFVIGQSK